MKRLFAGVMRIVSVIAQPIKAYMLKDSHRVRVVVLAENSLLLVRSSVGTQRWSLPGGGIKRREKPVQAAVRELREETNLNLAQKDFSLLGTADMPIRLSKGVYHVTFFVVRLHQKSSPKVVRPLEMLDAAWHAVNQLPEPHSPTIDRAFELLQEED